MKTSMWKDYFWCTKSFSSFVGKCVCQKHFQCILWILKWNSVFGISLLMGCIIANYWNIAGYLFPALAFLNFHSNPRPIPTMFPFNTESINVDKTFRIKCKFLHWSFCPKLNSADRNLRHMFKRKHFSEPIYASFYKCVLDSVSAVNLGKSRFGACVKVSTTRSQRLLVHLCYFRFAKLNTGGQCSDAPNEPT